MILGLQKYIIDLQLPKELISVKKNSLQRLRTVANLNEGHEVTNPPWQRQVASILGILKALNAFQGEQSMPPQSAPLWQSDYFKLKLLEKQPGQEELSDPPLPC